MEDHKYTTNIPVARTKLNKIADKLESSGDKKNREKNSEDYS